MSRSKSTHLCTQQQLSKALRQSFRLAVKLLQESHGPGLLASDSSVWVLWWTNLHWVKISPSTPTCPSHYYSTNVLDPHIYLPPTRDITLAVGSGVK